MRKTIGYHTRLDGNNSVKVTGGSFGGQVDMETVERLASDFDVKVLNSGRPVFVDKQGRAVCLYVTIDPESTSKGQAALEAWHKECAARSAREAAQAEAEADELEQAMSGLSHSEIVARLRGG